MSWKYNSILDHAGYKEELDMLNAIKNEILELENETIPDLQEKADQTKKDSLKEGSKTTWQDVEQIRHDIEKWQYRVKMLHEQQQEQQMKADEQAEEARQEIKKEVEQKKIKALKNSMQGFEMLDKAHKDNKEIDRYQQKALKLSGREFTRKKAKIPVDMPNPVVQNVVWDIWLKKANDFLKGKEIKEIN